MKNIYKFISSPSYQSTKYLFKFEFDITIQIQIRTHPRNHPPLSYLTNTRTRATRNLTIRYLFEDTRIRFIIPQLVVFPATDYHPPFTILGSTTTGSPALSFQPSRPSTRSITPTIRLYTGDIGRKRLGESITKQPISLDRYEDRSLPPSLLRYRNIQILLARCNVCGFPFTCHPSGRTKTRPDTLYRPR